MLEVAESEKSRHILAGLDTGTIEKNIINRDHGILDEWGALAEYRGRGAGGERMPHILFHTSKGDRIIYVLGYDNRRRWKKALGGQYGCVYIDEMNIADIDFVREAVMRCDYFIGTLNPDDPRLPVYQEFINHARPLPAWAGDTPESILEELRGGEPKPGWTHWFFGFRDNIALTEEKIERIKRNVPVGTKLWKNKIEGLRGRATGLVFPDFHPDRHVKSAEWLQGQIAVRAVRWAQLTAGLDTSYSASSADTVAMTMQGIAADGRLFILEERVMNNADRPAGHGFAPSDIAAEFKAFLDEGCRRWGMLRSAFVDSADQATLTELWKYRRDRPCPYLFRPSRKLPVIDRINLQTGWLQQGDYIVLEHCREHIRELGCYSWDEDGRPEDRNDHTINSCQYGWTPYRDRIGRTGGARSEIHG
jgi:hypothetical protein